nr:hypothetical protein [Tanacetum cinerariifolium]
YQDIIPFNLEVTPPSTKGKEVASSASVEARNGDHQSDMSAGFVGNNGNRKRTEDEDDVLETPVPSVGTRHSKLQYQDSLPFNLEVTPPSAKGKEVASSASVEDRNGDHQSDIFRTLHISSSTT